MKAHPLELRQRIVEAVDQREHTVEEVATIFNVSTRYVYQLLKLRRETGDLSPLPHGGGAVAKMDESKLLELAALIGEFPDATLAELQELLRRRCRVKVSINTVWRALRQIDFTLKKVPPGARSQPGGASCVRQKTNDFAGQAALVFG
ncbi:MAG: transposase [Acidobacteriota bacterium]|nr:MAG: transposase [Acidobacteriota bacterium]QQS45451.1 MAG: transposase [Acidobacteriota bacterium]